jgi:catalase
LDPNSLENDWYEDRNHWLDSKHPLQTFETIEMNRKTRNLLKTCSKASFKASFIYWLIDST